MRPFASCWPFVQSCDPSAGARRNIGTGMPGRRSINGVLCGFLGTYTSRYSDFDGYWVFGFLVAEVVDVKFNLLGDGTMSVASPLAFAEALAKARFSEQMGKAALPFDWLAEASLEIARSTAPTRGLINGVVGPGFDVTFVARVVSDLGTVYRRTASAFVAPHDPLREQQSRRAGITKR
jgi:hypothetical protein